MFSLTFSSCWRSVGVLYGEWSNGSLLSCYQSLLCPMPFHLHNMRNDIQFMASYIYIHVFVYWSIVLFWWLDSVMTDVAFNVAVFAYRVLQASKCQIINCRRHETKHDISSVAYGNLKMSRLKLINIQYVFTFSSCTVTFLRLGEVWNKKPYRVCNVNKILILTEILPIIQGFFFFFFNW